MKIDLTSDADVEFYHNFAIAVLKLFSFVP